MSAIGLSSATVRSDLVDGVVAAVRAAGAAILDVYEAGTEVQYKADRSPLTAADLAAHRVLTSALGGLSPALPVVSEEGGLPAYEERSHWPAYWLVDPLDGTKEFLARNGEFTVNVALIESGRPTLGVVGVPVKGLVFVGDVPGGRAVRRDAFGDVALKARRYSGREPVVVASRRHGGEALTSALARLEAAHGAPVLRNVGSSLKLCLLAEGEADVYPRLAPTSEWDTAAAHAVLEAAGGAVLQLTGEPLRYTKPDILNPEFVAVADAAVDWVRLFRGQELVQEGRPS